MEAGGDEMGVGDYFEMGRMGSVFVVDAREERP